MITFNQPNPFMIVSWQVCFLELFTKTKLSFRIAKRNCLFLSRPAELTLLYDVIPGLNFTAIIIIKHSVWLVFISSDVKKTPWYYP